MKSTGRTSFHARRRFCNLMFRYAILAELYLKNHIFRPQMYNPDRCLETMGRDPGSAGFRG